ncbi:hypothetical protein [Paenibacillus sp. Mc5Re-14]|uniref:hypothetical protein n=1 Tax=Paenibacillus sp. Mc5Re-14 TaxID=1030529 RepID=UPI000ADBB684|nr:hypothetical protein [Paenibacillus sp. Mc5Re-14]
MKSNLLPKGKLDKWILSYKDVEGFVVLELDNKGEIFLELIAIRERGVNMDSVSVFPPRSNVTYAQFLIS